MEAIIFIGIQGAGKSTFYKKHFFNTHLRINLDQLNTRNKENILINCCLEMKQRFVVDNNNPTIESRKKYIELAKKYRYKLIAYYFDTDVKVALARNAVRSGKAKVPDKGIWATRAKLERPTFAEGFDRVFVVTTDQKNNTLTKEITVNLDV